ncbi:MAG: S8 family serine peptidase, partial [Catenulispora sp.]
DAVERWRHRSPLNLGQESASVGAPTWWAAGFRGGRGSNDLPANLAVDQDPVLRSHPAFSGINFEVPPGASQIENPSITRHGTALLSIAAAQGPSGCPLCHAADVDEKGAAVGVSKVLDPSGAVAETDWAAGIPYYWYDNTTSRWKLQPGASDPAQVINYSRGNDSDYDDSLDAQQWDATVDTYGVTATVAAGNSGPALKTINDPALAYNVIGVGAFSGGGTTDPTDDSVFGWSSRGPTVGGRKKPDLVAVGDGGLADSYYQSTAQLWKYDTGTSYSAPQVAGGAILLAGAGIRDPKVVKAILINSARPGRVTPASAMGTQTGWQPDWGWGELNLDAAFHERLNFARGEIPSNGARFFKATIQQPGDRATLTWNRRVADCKPLRQGCYYDTNSGFRVYTLSNLDLTQYDALTGTAQATSASAVDNVEQVRAPASGSVVYKVTAGEVDGPAGEPFAITGTRPLTPLVTPQPTTALTASPQGLVRAGQMVRIQAQATNPSPDLSAESAQVTLAAPPGVELVEGQPTQPLGTLTPKGTPGDRATAIWTVRSSLDGDHQLVATTSASKYGSTFRSSAAASFSVDAAAPRVTVAAPGANPTS